MLDINLVRNDPDAVRKSLLDRGESPALLDQVLALDTRRREVLKESEALRATRNAVSKDIGRMSDAAAREAKKAEMRAVGDRISTLESDLREVESQLEASASALPNIPDPRTPVGPDEDHNVVLRVVEGSAPEPTAKRPHWEIGPSLGLIDFDRGVKLAGSRFYVLNGLGARLERALIAFMLDLHTKQGYREVYVPFVVKERALFAAAQLPKFRDNLYRDVEDDFWFVPTAEVPLTNLHADEIVSAEQLPLRYTAYTPCFRREKMSAGRDVRGIKRGHQFDKVEMYSFVAPDQSDAELERMREHAEETCRALGFTYRVKQLCTGDLGFGSRITYDIEVWAPGCDEWLEVSSVSNVGDFQARRANVKYRPETGGKSEFVHTLNGSGLGLPRTLIAILENYQRSDGSVVVPEVLRAFVGVEVIANA